MEEIGGLPVDEVNRRVNFVYRHLVNEFHPAVKKLVEAGSMLFKALVGLANAQKAYAEALEKLAATSKTCHSDSRNTGFAMHEVSEFIKQAQQEHDDLELWRLYHKGQKNIGKEMQKVKKNGMTTDDLQSQLQQVRTEGLRQALKEEKKRYNFLLERHTAWMERYTHFQQRNVQTLNQKIKNWRALCQESEGADEEEPAAALALLDSAIQGEATPETPSAPDLHTFTVQEHRLQGDGHVPGTTWEEKDSRSTTSTSMSELKINEKHHHHQEPLKTDTQPQALPGLSPSNDRQDRGSSDTSRPSELKAETCSSVESDKRF